MRAYKLCSMGEILVGCLYRRAHWHPVMVVLSVELVWVVRLESVPLVRVWVVTDRLSCVRIIAVSLTSVDVALLARGWICKSGTAGVGGQSADPSYHQESNYTELQRNQGSIQMLGCWVLLWFYTQKNSGECSVDEWKTRSTPVIFNDGI